jgi:alkanesulfonate monooxygenase SsuD/methylene tetrahydromethanopterin reductase-like flavin-dependent oxidoreductase (luciferase family)
MATTFDTESEAQAVAAELNAAAGRDARYCAGRYREKWAIACQSKRTYWGWDEFLVQLDLPKPAPRQNDVETVRQIVNLALGDGMEMVVLMTLLESGNKNGISKSLSDAGAAQASIVVHNSLFTRLITMIAREFAKSRDGDMHLGRAIELLEEDTLAIFQGVGSPDDLSAAIEDWKKLRGDQRLNSLTHFRDKQTAHLGSTNPDIPPAINKELFSLGEATVDLIDRLAKGTGMTHIKIRDNIDAQNAVDAYWKPWVR